MLSIISIQNCRLLQKKKTPLSLILILACEVLEMLTFIPSFFFVIYLLCSSQLVLVVPALLQAVDLC